MTSRSERTSRAYPAAAAEDVRISANKNDHGSYDYQKTTINYTPDRVTLQSGNAATSVDLEIGKNQPSVTGGRGGMNQDISISANKNDHGSYDYQKRTIVYTKATTTAVSDWATETVKVRTAINDTNVNQSISNGEASSHPNEHGSATTRIVEISPKAIDTGWIKWTSVDKSPKSVRRYNNALRIFKNLKNVPTDVKGHASVNANINRHGLFDGTIVTSELEDWEEVDSGSGDSAGGIRTGTIYGKPDIINGVKFIPVYKVKVYFGIGNRGQLASELAHGGEVVSSAGGCTTVRTFSYWKKEK